MRIPRAYATWLAVIIPVSLPFAMVPAAAAASLTITTGSLPNGVDGVAFSSQLNSTGGTGAVTWKLASGSALVTGLKLSATGMVSGTPTGSTEGPATFSVVATDSASTANTATAQIPYIINPENGAFRVSTTSLPNALQNSSYSTQLASTGGTGTVTWKVIPGNGANGLSPGLNLASNGVLSGKPQNLGEFNFWVQATDSSATPKTVTAFMGLIVNSSSFMVATSGSIGTGVEGSNFFNQLLAVGGTGTVTWKLASGSSLVAGLKLSVTGAVQGTPTAATKGSVTFGVVATDSASHTATQTLSYTINPAGSPPNGGLSVSPNLGPAYVDTAYSEDLSVDGGTSPYHWALASGSSLPLGLKLSTTGTITGKATTTDANFTFNVKVADSSSPKQTATATVSLPVYAEVAHCTPKSPSAATNARLKGAYSFQLEQINLNHNDGLSWVMGTFNFNGAGKITSGLFDSNGPTYSKEQNGTLTGTYSVGTDDRGLLTLRVPGSTGLIDVCFALDTLVDGVATGGAMVEDDDSETAASGRFYAQGGSNLTKSSVKGSWAFGTQGGKITGGGTETRHTSAGYLTLNGAGEITVGEIDLSEDKYESDATPVNQYLAQVPLKGTYTLAASGRGTITLDLPAGSTPANFHQVFYVAGPDQILLLDSDVGETSPTNALDTNNAIGAGRALKRTATTFNNATLKGTSVFLSTSLSKNTSITYGRDLQAGILKWSGAGKLAGSFDDNDAGTVTLAPSNTISADYAVDAEGRVTLSGTSGGKSPVFYLAGPNEGFGVEADFSVPFMRLENQTVPSGGFKATNFSGAYSVGSLWYSFVEEPAVSAEITADDTTLSLAGTQDSNTTGDIAVDQSFSLTFTPATTGRFLFKDGSNTNSAVYFVSPDKAYSLPIGGSDPWKTLLEFNHH